MASALGFVFGVEAKVNEGVVAEGRGHEDVAAVAAIAAGGAALGNKFFTPEGHAAVATVAGLDPDSCFINKHAISSVQGEAEVARLLILLDVEMLGPQEWFRLLGIDLFTYTGRPNRNHLLMDVCECCRTDL